MCCWVIQSHNNATHVTICSLKHALSCSTWYFLPRSLLCSCVLCRCVCLSGSPGIHKATMTSFAINLYGQCCQCRLHVVGQAGQWIVGDISIVRSCWNICSLRSESNNGNLLYYTCSLLYLERLFCLKYQTQLVFQHGDTYLVTRIQNLVTSLHLIYYWLATLLCSGISQLPSVTYLE